MAKSIIARRNRQPLSKLSKKSSNRQHISVMFATSQRETIRKAIEKLRSANESSWRSGFDSSGEIPFIRDAATFAAQCILAGDDSREKVIAAHAKEIDQLAFSVESECAQLPKKLRVLKPTRKRRAA